MEYQIIVEKPSLEKIETLGLDSWSFWECEPSKFDWEYSSEETAYILKGKVLVTPENGEPVEINAGDLVVFPAGLKCTWEVIEKIEKKYKFN